MLLAIWNYADFASLPCPLIVALKCLPGLEKIQGNQIFGQICFVLSGSLAASARSRARAGEGEGGEKAEAGRVRARGQWSGVITSWTYLIFIEGADEAETVIMSL